jgi:hypothetical protein
VNRAGIFAKYNLGSADILVRDACAGWEARLPFAKEISHARTRKAGFPHRHAHFSRRLGFSLFDQSFCAIKEEERLAVVRFAHVEINDQRPLT